MRLRRRTYRERVFTLAAQLRGIGEPGSMSDLVRRADAFLRTGRLPAR